MAVAQKHILVVDDEMAIADTVAHYLKREGYRVETATTGNTALEKLAQTRFDLIVLDLMLPDISGLQITRILKTDAKTKDLPIIFLTAKADEVDVVIGFELDIDDYITKPFSARVLVARINSILRKKDQVPEMVNLLTIGQLTLDTHKRDVNINGVRVDLTKTEFDLLLLLMVRKGWVYTRTQIVDALKGSDYAVTDRSVDAQIMNLRKKLGPCGAYIETIRGVGYKFKEDV